MNDNYNFQIRLTGILVMDEKILLVKQRLSKKRAWSLPGGRLESGETIEVGIVREMYEETGFTVKIDKLLYICDVPNTKTPLIHITFLLEKISRDIQLPTNEFDENPIYDVKFVPINELSEFGFSDIFIRLATQGFPDDGSYMGNKTNIGLGI